MLSGYTLSLTLLMEYTHMYFHPSKLAYSKDLKKTKVSPLKVRIDAPSLPAIQQLCLFHHKSEICKSPAMNVVLMKLTFAGPDSLVTLLYIVPNLK